MQKAVYAQCDSCNSVNLFMRICVTLLAIYRLYRDACVEYPGWPYVKDLSRLGRDLSSTIIVDDCTLMFQAQPSNAIWVTPYDPCTGPHDDVLAQVLQLLMLLVSYIGMTFSCCMIILHSCAGTGQRAGTYYSNPTNLVIAASSHLLGTCLSGSPQWKTRIEPVHLAIFIHNPAISTVLYLAFD